MIHGGSGSGGKSKKAQEKMLKVIQKALAEGHDLLKNGAKGEDVVVKVISILEDSPLFNSGRGGNKNKEGFIELDASIMRGNDKNCGAVSAIIKSEKSKLLEREPMRKTIEFFLLIAY